ncbi:MAG: hypothetical protein NTU41_09215, partial [Chloroflexi bacterium]|nr:hypothetical protein [Chloroflexota bacterium]
FDMLWDPGETVNVDSRDLGAAKGTDVKDLCSLVGGASAGDTIKIKAVDGFSKWFDYDSVYSPAPEQGKMVLSWYNATFGGYVPAYGTGMRLIFFAGTTNADGKHVYGNGDMHETLPESRWHYFYSGGVAYPSSSGLSVQVVSNIEIHEPNLISCDASGSEKDSFAAGETVYLKGVGLIQNTTYKMWIQDEGVIANDSLTEAQDPSGAQETATTDDNGDFGPLAVWDIALSTAPHFYDIVADNQAAGTQGKYENQDAIDSPGWQGLETTAAPGAPVLLWGPYLTGTTMTGTTVNAKTDVASAVTVEYATEAYFAGHGSYDRTAADGLAGELHHVALSQLEL